MNKLPQQTCKICGKPSKFVNIEGNILSKCFNCKYLWLDNPTFDPAKYEQGYFPETNENSCISKQSEQFYKSTFERINIASNSNINILDVGCGTGGWLMYLLKKGLKGSGVEISQYYCGEARKKGLVVINKPIEEAGLNSDEYDLVTLAHVLEHVHKLTLVFTEIKRIIKAGGILYIEVPNEITAWIFILRRVLNKIGFSFKTSINYSITQSGHTNFFTPKSLRLLLEKMGWEIAKLGSYDVVIKSNIFIKVLLFIPGLLFTRILNKGEYIYCIAKKSENPLK